MNAYIEEDCTIEHEGKAFTSGGSYLVNCTDGIARGVVYLTSNANFVTTWHGKKIADLDTYTVYRGNFCRMARISFRVNGIKFVGDYCPDWSEACKVRSTKKATLS